MNEMKTAHVHPQGGATRKEADTLSEGLFWMMHTHTHVIFLSKKGVGRCFCFFLLVFLMKKKSEFVLNCSIISQRKRENETKKSKKIKTPCISPFQEKTGLQSFVTRII